MEKTKAYWDERYRDCHTGWDIGSVSRPMKEFIDHLPRVDLQILVPGAGKGYEVGYLHRRGYKSVYALDISEVPFEKFRETYPDFPEDHLLVGDFFSLEDIKFDLILEQTFFCALRPQQREDYARKMHALLREGGTLAGLLFDFPLKEDGPPFGGHLSEYRDLFAPFFTIRKLERAYNSIPPRQGSELFFIFDKKTI